MSLTWPLTQREELRLKMFEKSVQRVCRERAESVQRMCRECAEKDIWA